MKVSDYIVKTLFKKGIRHVFGYPGGMVTGLMDSLSKFDGIANHLNYNEQGAGFAACAYAQSTGLFGVAYATSGPGATNLITPLCHAFFDSIPFLVITGQVNRAESKDDLRVRQRGFQETDIVEMVKNVTKYSAYVRDPLNIGYELEKAIHYAVDGRPGGVLLDVPIDVLREEINEEALIIYRNKKRQFNNKSEIKTDIIESLEQSKRPVLLLGNGINSSNLHKSINPLVERFKIPVVSSMTAVDILPSSSEYYFGFIGAYGHRYANFVVSKCDLLITIGSRLDLRQTGAYKENFAPDAKLIRFDIDDCELENKIKNNEHSYLIDLKYLLEWLKEIELDVSYSDWIEQCNYYKNELKGIDNTEPNIWISQFSDIIHENSLITTDVGQNQVWIAQSFKVKNNQRILFSGGHGAMGFSLPASIGAFLGSNKPTYCFSGDGGFQMNIQELQFIVRERLPIKIIILNNSSLGMIRHFQEMYFESNYSQTTIGNGYSNPNFVKVGEAYGLRSFNISKYEQIKDIEEYLTNDEPVLINLILDEITYVYPKLEYKQPVYDQEPKLEREFLYTLLSYGDSNE